MDSQTDARWLISGDAQADKGALFLPSVGEYPIYDDLAYRFMMNDSRRVSALAAALRRSVSGDSTVVELGCGSEAPWARLAVDLGARRVVAVEQLQSVRSMLSQSLADDPDYSRIDVMSPEEYIQAGLLPDILVSEVVGAIGSSEGAERVVGTETQRINNPTLSIFPNGWVTEVSAFSWRRMLRGNRPMFVPEARRYLQQLRETVGRGDPRLCVVGPTVRLGALSSPGAVETAEFAGAHSSVTSTLTTLTIRQAGHLDSLLFTVRVLIGDQVVSSLHADSSWLPVVVPLTDEGVSTQSDDELEVELERTYLTNPVCPDYSVRWSVRRQTSTIAQGTTLLPWRPDETAARSALHRALLEGAGD